VLNVHEQAAVAERRRRRRRDEELRAQGSATGGPTGADASDFSLAFGNDQSSAGEVDHATLGFSFLRIPACACVEVESARDDGDEDAAVVRQFVTVVCQYMTVVCKYMGVYSEFGRNRKGGHDKLPPSFPPAAQRNHFFLLPMVSILQDP
jgi:hypothetical protein